MNVARQLNLGAMCVGESYFWISVKIDEETNDFVSIILLNGLQMSFLPSKVWYTFIL